MAQRRMWFVRRGEDIKGPFFSAQITRNILLGRLRPDDQLSPDEVNWQAVAKHRELYPDVMQASPVDPAKLEQAKIQVDERIKDQRQQKKDMKSERRRAKDRRANESNAMLSHRAHREQIEEASRNNIYRPRAPIISIILMLLIIIAFGYHLRFDGDKLQADCNLPPTAGVNWSNCTFINLYAENQQLSNAVITDATLVESRLMGTNLKGSDMAYAKLLKADLSYANLEGVRLVGADLKQADLRYANLKDADLSFADLNQALLGGANIEGARFDNSIWIDNKVCAKGSIGDCQ